VGVLQRFERRIEEMVNRPFARAFKAEVQPVEIASALQRECDDRAAIVARGRTMVPNVFTVALGDHDHERLSTYAEALGVELSAMVTEYAEEQRYAFLGPVSVEFERDSDLETGRFRVHSMAVAAAVPANRATAETKTPAATAGNAPWLEVGATTYTLRSSTTRIGRGADSDLRIDDPGISRHHAEIRQQGGDVVIVDAGSTNGIVIDNQRVEQARLADGVRIKLGNTTLVFHAGPR
jgi:Protein of unknown function (DUF3662)/FHA domain